MLSLQRVARLHDLGDLMLEAARLEFDIESTFAAGRRKDFVERGNLRAFERAALNFAPASNRLSSSSVSSATSPMPSVVRSTVSS